MVLQVYHRMTVLQETGLLQVVAFVGLAAQETQVAVFGEAAVVVLVASKVGVELQVQEVGLVDQEGTVAVKVFVVEVMVVEEGVLETSEAMELVAAESLEAETVARVVVKAKV